MKCPNCGDDDNQVHQTYSHHNYLMKKNLRTRHCHSCGYLFDTEETPTGKVYRLRNGKKVQKSEESQSSLFNDN